MVIQAVQRNMRHAAKAVHEEMERGLSSLATISSTAPFFGVFGTLLGIVGTFRGGSFSADSGLTMVTSGLSEAMIFTALGLAAAILPYSFHSYLQSKVNKFDAEMAAVALELANLLRP